jgi:SAM-dependent methyltransferase
MTPTVPPGWGDLYFGDVYFQSVADLLGPELSDAEAKLIGELLELEAGERVLDLACGHGRHAARVRRHFHVEVVGLDRSAAYLAKAAGIPRIRADVRALPLRPVFDAVYSWYNALFMFDDATNVACLRGAAAAMKHGGRLLVHHTNPRAVAVRPVEHAERALSDGTRVEEASRFDVGTGVDALTRKLTRPSGYTVAATAHLRYYTPDEWIGLASRAGLRLSAVRGLSWGREGLETTSPGPEVADLVALLEKA